VVVWGRWRLAGAAGGLLPELAASVCRGGGPGAWSALISGGVLVLGGRGGCGLGRGGSGDPGLRSSAGGGARAVARVGARLLSTAVRGGAALVGAAGAAGRQGGGRGGPDLGSGWASRAWPGRVGGIAPAAWRWQFWRRRWCVGGALPVARSRQAVRPAVVCYGHGVRGAARTPGRRPRNDGGSGWSLASAVLFVAGGSAMCGRACGGWPQRLHGGK
jgi:hypothetical protein